MRLESEFEVLQTLGADRYRETILVRDRSDGTIRVAKKYWITSDCGWQNVSLLDNFARCFENALHRGESLPGIPALIDTFTQVDPVTSHDVEVKIWEYIEGDPLGSDTAPTKVLAPTEIDEMVKSLLKTVEHLTNQGLVHADIKPSNIIRGTDGHWYLIDLDTISRGYQTMVGTNSYRGTLAFMAPERFTGRITFLSDLYGIALSIIMTIAGLSTDQMFNYRDERLAYDLGRLFKEFSGLAPILSWLNRALLITDPFVSVQQAQDGWNDCWRTPRVGSLNEEYRVLTLSGAYCETKYGVFWWRREGQYSILSLIKGGTGEIQNLHYEDVAGRDYSIRCKPKSWISNESLELGIDYGEFITYQIPQGIRSSKTRSLFEKVKQGMPCEFYEGKVFLKERGNTFLVVRENGIIASDFQLQVNGNLFQVSHEEILDVRLAGLSPQSEFHNVEWGFKHLKILRDGQVLTLAEYTVPAHFSRAGYFGVRDHTTCRWFAVYRRGSSVFIYAYFWERYGDRYYHERLRAMGISLDIQTYATEEFGIWSKITMTNSGIIATPTNGGCPLLYIPTLRSANAFSSEG